MVNINARNERHAKLKQENVELKTHSLSSVNVTVATVKEGIKRIFKNQNNSPLISQLFRKVAVLVAVFLIVTPFMSTYQLTHGSFSDQLGYDDLGVFEFTEQGSEHTIEDVMTEDGFLLKPAINSVEGDRSGFSDIFMYTVESGDTLSSIASSFNLKQETIMAENDLWNPNSLRVGSKLKILPVDGLSHKVKKDETVTKLAKTYKVEKETITKQNQLESDTLTVNTIIIIPGAKKSAPVYRRTTAPTSIANYSGPKANGRLIWPTAGKITQKYHSRHRAVDIANSSKGSIYAAAGGKVIKAATGWNGGYGNMVIIDHGDGMETLYAHNEKLYVKVGQYVEQGDTIAWMGNSGRVYGKTGIHVHFEVRIKGVKYNPMNFF